MSLYPFAITPQASQPETTFYSPETQGFYNTAINGSAIPSDAIAITADEHRALLREQSVGRRLAVSEEGKMFSQEPLPASEEVLALLARQKRSQLLRASDWTQLVDVAPATAEKWLTYRQALRDVSKQPLFPNQVEWPTSP